MRPLLFRDPRRPGHPSVDTASTPGCEISTADVRIFGIWLDYSTTGHGGSRDVPSWTATGDLRCIYLLRSVPRRRRRRRRRRRHGRAGVVGDSCTNEWIRGTVADWAGSFRMGRYGFWLSDRPCARGLTGRSPTMRRARNRLFGTKRRKNPIESIVARESSGERRRD